MRERLARGRGFNETYYDGEDAQILIETGDVFPSEERREEYWEFNDEPIQWEVLFEKGCFKKMALGEVTVYVVYERAQNRDEEFDVDFAIAQYP